MDQKEKQLINEVRERLVYFPETGEMYWSFSKKNSTRVRGLEAGTIEKRSHGNRRKIKILGKQTYRYRLAFLIEKGFFPLLVDHINGNSYDDRWCNLRDVSFSQNQWNRKKNSNAKLPVGVRKNGNCYFVRISKKGKELYVGSYSTLGDAINARIMAELEHWGENSRAILNSKKR